MATLDITRPATRHAIASPLALREKWNAVYQRHLDAERAMREALAATDLPNALPYLTFILDAVSEADDAALDDLLSTPAPDLAAVLRKVEIVHYRDRGMDDLEGVIADLRRLSQGGLN